METEKMSVKTKVSTSNNAYLLAAVDSTMLPVHAIQMSIKVSAGLIEAEKMSVKTITSQRANAMH